MLPQYISFCDDSLSLQEPFDVAVVIPTVLRATLTAAIESVYRQEGNLRIQILLGVDTPESAIDDFRDLFEAHPKNCAVQVLYPGYSTFVRHGGLHPARDGGVLRSVLTYLANSRFVSYLDDDNWYGATHLAGILGSIDGADWTFSQRWFVDASSRQSLCVDLWESVGPDAGVFKKKFGGFVDPNCLMIDKIACEPAIRWWSIPLRGDAKAMSADRHVFNVLSKNYRLGKPAGATVFYQLDETDGMQPQRKRWIEKEMAERSKSSPN